MPKATAYPRYRRSAHLDAIGGPRAGAIFQRRSDRGFKAGNGHRALGGSSGRDLGQDMRLRAFPAAGRSCQAKGFRTTHSSRRPTRLALGRVCAQGQVAPLWTYLWGPCGRVGHCLQMNASAHETVRPGKPCLSRSSDRITSATRSSWRAACS